MTQKQTRTASEWQSETARVWQTHIYKGFDSTMTEILAKTQASMQDTMGSPMVNPHSATASSKGFQQFPYSSSTSAETIAELEKQATDLRTSYRSVSKALFEFGDKLN